MAKKYLKGSSVESDPSREKARLSGIANELYILRVESKGSTYDIGKFGTLYGNKIFQKKEDSGLLNELGGIIWTYYDAWVLEIDTLQDEYQHMIQLHKDLLVDDTTLISEGWDLTP